MMNYNKEQAAEVALNATGLDNDKELRKLSGDDNSLHRSFGLNDLWSIRRSAKIFKIHSRIPRL